MVLTTTESWVEEITDFLLSRPTLEEIVDFRRPIRRGSAPSSRTPSVQ